MPRALLLLLLIVVASCPVPALPAEGEGEGEGEVPSGDIVDAVNLGDAVAAISGPILPLAMVPRPPAGIVVADLGDVVVGDAGDTGAFFVDVDPRITALTIMVYGAADATVMLTRVQAPDGTIVVDDTPLRDDVAGYAQIENLSRGFTGQYASAGRVLPATCVGAFQVPSTADISLTSGRWRLQVGQFEIGSDDNADPVVLPRPGAVRVLVLLRTAPTTSGQARLAFHFTGGGELTASSARSDPAFIDALTTVQRIYGAAGVDLGESVDDVDLVDVANGEALRTIALDLPRCDGPELDEVAAVGLPDRLNIVVVDRFECGSFGPFLLGLAAGLPMVPWTGATPHSSVVVAGSFFVADPTNLATVIAHELGHGLGLYHAQENNRFGADLYDVISDTDDGPGAADNLMFFDLSQITTTSLSTVQARTIQRAPQVLP